MELKLLDKSHTYYVYCRSGKRTIGSYNSITIKPEKYVKHHASIFLRLFYLNIFTCQVLFLQHWLASDIDTEFLKDTLVYIAQHHSAVSLTATQLRQLL